jgi:hypothetical protein
LIAGKDISEGMIYFNQINGIIQKTNHQINSFNKIKHLGWIDNIEKLQANADICLGKGRSVIQPAMMGRICFVLAETGVLTRVNRANFQSLYEYNFSGRGKHFDNRDELIDVLTGKIALDTLFDEAMNTMSIVRKAYLAEYAESKINSVYKNLIQNNRIKTKLDTMIALKTFLIIYIYKILYKNKYIKH